MLPRPYDLAKMLAYSNRLGPGYRRDMSFRKIFNDRTVGSIVATTILGEVAQRVDHLTELRQSTFEVRDMCQGNALDVGARS